LVYAEKESTKLEDFIVRFIKMMPVLLVTVITVMWSTKTIEATEVHDHHATIGALVYGSHNVATLEGFKAGLEERGFIEGKNITYLFDGPYKKIKDLDTGMEKLMVQNPDLIVVTTTPGAQAAKKATNQKKVPIVFGPVNDPVSAGIVESQKQPGDNITGVRLTDCTAKQLEWAVRISPWINKIFIPYNPNDKSSLISLQKLKEAVAMFGFHLTAKEIQNHEEIDALLGNFPTGFDAIFLPRDGMIMSRIEDFAKVAKQKKLILSSTRLEMAKKGALFGFGFNSFELGRQMARLADLILHGSNPGKLPIETAEDYLSINLKVADILGITISENILRQAHIIIRPE
jgi:putative tryptophan/tyrosine transport system substrate-binding protein